MKRTITKTLALLAAFLGLHAFAVAPTPVAVFEGADLNAGTSGGYTLTLNGNTFSYGTVTIANDATKGVQVTPPNHNQTTVSILVRYSSLDQSTASGNPVFVSTSQGKNDATEYADVGVWASTTQFVGFWKDTGTYGPITYSAASAGYMLFTSSVNGSDTTGVFGYFGTKSGDNWTWSSRIGVAGLRFTGTDRYYDNFAIGGPNGTGANATSKPAFKGLKIEGIAIFDTRLTTNQAAEYRFPSEMPANARVINFNVNQNGLTTMPSVDQKTLVGTVPVAKWTTVGQPNNGTATATANKAYNPSTGAESDISSVQMTSFCNQGSNWSYLGDTGKGGTAAEVPADEYAYLKCFGSNRDRSLNNRAYVKLEGIPFRKYDVYFYFSGGTSGLGSGDPNIGAKSDLQSHFGVISRSDAEITSSIECFVPDATGALVARGSNTYWGERVNAPTPVIGKNVVVLKDQTDANVTLGYIAANCAVAAVQIVDSSSEVISINIAGGDNSDGDSPIDYNVKGDAKCGLESVAGKTWNNYSKKWKNKRLSSMGVIKATQDDTTTVERPDVFVNLSANNTYRWGDATDAFLKGYLDDGGDHAQVTVYNVPYTKYDVIVYAATDSGSKFSAPTVNSTTYTCGSDGVATAGSDAWGTAKQTAAAYGVNAMIVKDQTASTLTIVGGANSNGARGGIAAIQIVCTGAIKDPLTVDTVAFTPSSADWNDRTLPTSAKAANVTATKAFGADTDYFRATGSRGATIAHVTGASNAVNIYGLNATGSNGGGAVERDVYLKVDAGNVHLISGGEDANYGTNTKTIPTGNLLTQVGGTTLVDYIFGAGRGGGKDGVLAEIKGNVGVTIEGSARVRASAAAGWSSAHNAQPKVSGNTSMLVKSMQNPLDDKVSAQSSTPNGYLVGGSIFETNGGGGLITGNTSLTVDLGNEKSGTFAKHLVGGSMKSNSGGNAMTVNGSSSVVINAPSAVTFSGTVVGGGWAPDATASVGGSASVTINGGTYTGNIYAGGYGGATVAGAATLTINGGTFSGNLYPGTATGAKTLAINEDLTLVPSKVQSGFGTLTVADGKTLTLDPATDMSFALPTTASGAIVKTGAGNLTLSQSVAGASGATFSVSEGKLKFVLSTAEIEATTAFALFKTTMDDVSGKVLVVNSAGSEIFGDITIEDGTVKFLPKVDFFTRTVGAGGTFDWTDSGWTKGSESGVPCTPGEGRVGDVTVTLMGNATIKLPASTTSLASVKFVKGQDVASATVTFDLPSPATLPELGEAKVVAIPFVSPTLESGITVAYSMSTLGSDYFAKANGETMVVGKKSNSINIKFTPASATEGTIGVTDENVGGYPVAGMFWNHSKTSTDTQAGTTEIFALKDGNGATLDDVLCYYYMPNMYDVNKRNKNGRNKQTTGNGKLTYSYFDDSNRVDPPAFPYSVGTYGEREYFLPATPVKDGVQLSLRWDVAITNIPYQVFDLYIYQASDQTDTTIKLLPIAAKANDGDWKYFAGDNAGSTVVATYDATWNGAAYCDQAEMTEGTHYIRYRLSKAALGLGEGEHINVIYLSHPRTHDSARLGLAGVQIVEVANDGYYTRDPAAQTTGWSDEDTWLNSSGNPTTWLNPTGTDVAYATIDANSVAEVTVNSAITSTLVTVTSDASRTFTLGGTADGTLTGPIDLSGFWGTLALSARYDGELFPVGGRLVLDNAQNNITLGTTVSNVTLSAGTLKLSSAALMTDDSVLSIAGGTFDVNGFAMQRAYTLSGGSLVNNGGDIGDGTAQMNGLTLEGDASVGGSGNFGLLTWQYGTNTLALGTHTLTKTGANSFWLCNTTVTGTGKIVVSQGTLNVTAGNATVNDATVEVGASGTLTVNSGKTLTLGKLEEVSGATITNNGTINGLKELTDVDLTAIGGTLGFHADGVTLKGDVKTAANKFGSANVAMAAGSTLNVVVNGDVPSQIVLTTGSFAPASADLTTCIKINGSFVSSSWKLSGGMLYDNTKTARYAADVTGDVTWSTKSGLANPSCDWVDSADSTITLNATVDATLDFDTAVTAASFKKVGSNKLTIKAASLANAAIAAWDFSAGNVAIDCTGVAGGERILFSGTVSGTVTCDNLPSGYGLYQSGTEISLRSNKSNVYYNPVVTDASSTFNYAFFGTTDGDWAKVANWRARNTDGLWVPHAGNVPGVPGGIFQNMVFDGALATAKTVTLDTLEGWELRMAVLNGVNATVATCKRFQSEGTNPMWIWVDAASSLKFTNEFSQNNGNNTMSYYVAAKDGITFDAVFAKNAGTTYYYYYLKGLGSVKYAAGVTAGAHEIKRIELQIGAEEKTAHHVAKQALVTFTSCTPTFTTNGLVVASSNTGITPVLKETKPVVTDDVGTFYIAQESDGVYVYFVTYADDWDVVEPLTATIDAGTTDWTGITWTDAFSHPFTGLTDAHEYQVTAANGATLNFNAAVTATAIKLINSADETVTLTKGEVDIPTGLDYTGVAGKAVITWPVTALASSNDNVAYTGGNANDSAIQIAHNGGTLNLTGGTWKFQQSNNSTATTVNMTDVTASYPNSVIGIGMATYVIGGASAITTPSLVLSQGDAGRTAALTLKDTAVVTVTGSTIADQNTSSIMFGHWNGPSTFTIQDSAFFAATNAQVLVGRTGNNQTINLNGGTFVAKGIKTSGQAGGTNTLNINGGELVLGSAGIDSYSTGTTIPVTVGGDAKITSLAAMPITQPVTVSSGKLTLDAKGGAITVSGAFVNNGTVKVQGGLVRFTNYRGFVEIGEGGSVGYPIDINDAGVFTVPAGMDAAKVTLYKADGTAIEPTETKDGKIYYESSMEDFSAYWDYEFEGNGNNTGTEGTALSWDGGRPFEGNEYVMDATTGKKSLHVPSRPHRGVSSWSEAATFVMYGTMVGNNNRYQICFGTKSGNLLFLATGDASKNEVVLCKSTNNTPVPLCTMTVPNAQTTKHLYAFVLKKVGDKSAIDIYLDGALLQPYTFDSEFTLGGGFQIASPHGGEVTGYGRPTNDDPALLDFLRVYDKELNSDAMAKYAEEYPYNSPFGTYTRELTGAESTWVAADQWVSNGTEIVVSEPGTNSVLQITADGTAGLAVNLAESKTYENVTFGGDGTIAVTNDTVHSGKVKAKGRIVVNASTRLAIDAFETYGSAISIGNGKVLTLDLGNADIGKYWSSQSIDLTGAIICNDYDAQVKIEQPKTVKAPRTVAIRIDDNSKHAWADIYVPTNDIIGTVSGGNITWSWANTPIDEADIDFDQTEVAIKIVMGENQDFTLNEKLAKADLITVNGGNLNIGTNRNMTVTGTGTIDAKLSEDETTAAAAGEITLFNVSGAATLAYRNVTDKDGTALDIIGSNGKVRIRPDTSLKGLMFYMACPKPNYHDRDPNGRQSGWIDLVNYGPESVNLADYKLVRCNMGKEWKLTEAQEAVSNLLAKTIAKGETFRVYTSEEYDTAEDYGGTGREVAWFKTEGGAVVKSASAAGSIMVVPTKVNPKKYPMVRLYKGTEADGFAVVDEVVIPCDIDDDAVVEFGTDATKRERWVVQNGVRTEYGPDVNSIYGVKKAKTDLQLLNAKGFVKAGEDFQVALPVNPFGTNGVVLANNEIASVVLEYRTFDDSKEEDAMPTVELALDKGAKDKSQGQLWTNAIPASVMVAGKLIQYRAKITDVGGKTFYAPRFLNKDVGYKWYGAVVQPNLISAPVKDSTDVCVENLQTFLMFACGQNKTEMDKDVDKQTLPNKARCAIFDAQTGIYYDNVRVDLRGQTSSHFLKKSHGFRFSKVAPLACTNPFDGEEIECRKTSFIAEYADPIFMRQALALQVMRESGVKAPFDYPVRVYLNGKFYQLAFHSNRFTDEIVEDYYKLNAKTGYSYKNVGKFVSSDWESTGTEKKTPDDDNEKGDEAMAVITAYADRVDDAHASARTSEAMKYFNIPAWVNYMAATKITQEADDVWTNLGIYINLYDEFYNPDGDDTIRPLAYDQNLSFGQWYKGDDGSRPLGIVVTNDLMKSHPFYGGTLVRYHKWDSAKGKDSTTDIDGRWNRGMEVIFQDATFREALLRRTRTLMDKFLGAPGTAKADTPIWQWAQKYATAMTDDVSVDHDKWDYAHIGEDQAHCNAIWIWPTGSNAPTFQQGMDELWDTYITQRRIHLYDRHSATNEAFTIGYAQDRNAGIPLSQATTADLAAEGKIYVTDSQGRRNTEQGFDVSNGIIFIRNANTVAVDMTGWQLAGLAKVKFAEGTVLPSKKGDVNGKLIVVYDRVAARETIASMGTTEPVVVNIDKAKEYFTPENTTVCLRDDKGVEVQGTTFYITRAEGEDPSASTSQPAGTASIAVPMSWMEAHKIDTSVPGSVLAESMNTPMEGGNGATPWESYALGLSPEKPDSKPVIAPLQTTSPTHVGFKLANVTPAAGATVTYTVVEADEPGAQSWTTVTEEKAADATVQVKLPDTGVKYYKIQVKTVTQPVTE